MTITNQFEVQIVTLTGDNAGQVIAPNLAAAITSFDRELDDPTDEEEDDTDTGFLLADVADAPDEDAPDDEDEGDPQDHEDDEEEGEEELPDGVLTVQVDVTREVMDELATLREMPETRLGISFVYGGGLLTRTFEVSSAFWITLNSGIKEPTQLKLNVNCDVYDASTDF